MLNSSANCRPLFTVGHSNLEYPAFLASLVQYQVQVLCDVRSSPFSLRLPQFNRDPLSAALGSAGIQYEFLGDSLGGRPADPRAYQEDGLVDYAARRRSPEFSEGISRLSSFLQAGTAVVMCAEEDPLHCHRFLMIGPALLERGIMPVHIRRGGILESQNAAEDRLLVHHGFEDVTSTSLFSAGRDAALQDALALQAKDFAFRASPESAEFF